MRTKIISFTCIICLLCCFSFALIACQSEQTPGVVDAEINDKGELILIYQDGTEQNLGIVVGKDGSDGVNGEDGALVIDGYESVISAASAKGLRSAVSIVCNFKATVQQHKQNRKPKRGKRFDYRMLRCTKNPDTLWGIRIFAPDETRTIKFNSPGTVQRVKKPVTGSQ